MNQTDERFLSRLEASKYLKDKYGIEVAPKTLQKKATVGGGPVYQRFGRDALYTPKNLDAWVKGRLTAPSPVAHRRAA